MIGRDMDSSLNKKKTFIIFSINHYNIFCMNLSKSSEKSKNIIYQNNKYQRR